MKKFSLIISAILCVLLLSCQKADNTNKHITFTDDTGTEITLSERPQKVAVLFSSHAEMVLLSGGSIDITVGETIERGFAPDSTPLVDSGAGKQINSELLIASAPDFVVGSSDIAVHVDTAKLLNAAGIPAALFRVESFEDYERVMTILCGIFNGENEYRKNVIEIKHNIERIIEGVPKNVTPKILFIRCASSAKATKAKTKDNNFVCKMLYDLGTYNIAENAPVLLDSLSMEEILTQNPDFIFFSPMGDEEAAKKYTLSLLEKDEWQALDAVKNNNYTFLDKELFQYKPCGRWDKAYEKLAEFLYGR